MSPIPRTRSRSFGEDVGYIYPISNPSDRTPEYRGLGEEICEDTHGSKETANYFDLLRWKLKPGTITGEEAVWPVYGLDNMPYLNQPSPDFLPGADSAFIDPNAALTKVASWSSPGKAIVSLPNFLYELRELPAMVFKKKPTGRDPTKGNNSVAEINFGWAPTFSDIQKLFEFTAQFEQRKRELNAIYDRKGGLRRQRVVASSILSKTEVVAAHSFVCGVSVKRTNTTVARQWASLRWEPLFGALAEKPSARDIAAKAALSIHGWRANPKAVWDALPWSWLIDYFSNTGELLEALSNSFEYQPVNCCTMTLMHAKISDSVISHTGGFVVSPARAELVWKHRQPTSFAFKLNAPLLSTKQLVTLAGIASNWR
ncbi:MAG: putative maturation protein [Garnievirus faecadaptatum]|uniref:Maturation protein n=1 Tax=Leviviridae sp. TaxID=2027243 RepID=A0ABY3SSQ0_9VIRU|nr:MAG: putative maturation protein [Leviviridae sp.]